MLFISQAVGNADAFHGKNILTLILSPRERCFGFRFLHNIEKTMNKKNKSNFYECKYILPKTMLFVNQAAGNTDAFHGKNISTLISNPRERCFELRFLHNIVKTMN